MAANAALKIQLPEDERGRSAADIARIDRLTAKLARVDLKQKKREEIERELFSLLERPKAEADRAWQASTTAETKALAEGRGEVVEANPKAPLRILDRDPILSLLRAGAISREQYDVGVAVRDIYDLRMGDAASVPFEGMPSGRHDHERFISSRFVRAKAAIPVGQIEMAILNGHFRSRDGFFCQLTGWPALKAAGMEPHIALTVLRKVCGEHHSLTSLGRGRAYDRHRQALCQALDIATEVLDWRSPRSR